MAVVAQAYDFVVGIDTHSNTHTLAIISAVTGAEIANETFPSTSTGMNRALRYHRDCSDEQGSVCPEDSQDAQGCGKGTDGDGQGEPAFFTCHRGC